MRSDQIVLSRSVRPSLVTEKNQQSAKAFITAGFGLFVVCHEVIASIEINMPFYH
jgi:hypothetical protein